jgi:hypothetical protein
MKISSPKAINWTLKQYGYRLEWSERSGLCKLCKGIFLCEVNRFQSRLMKMFTKAKKQFWITLRNTYCLLLGYLCKPVVESADENCLQEQKGVLEKLFSKLKYRAICGFVSLLTARLLPTFFHHMQINM